MQLGGTSRVIEVRDEIEVIASLTLADVIVAYRRMTPGTDKCWDKIMAEGGSTLEAEQSCLVVFIHFVDYVRYGNAHRWLFVVRIIRALYQKVTRSIVTVPSWQQNILSPV